MKEHTMAVQLCIIEPKQIVLFFLKKKTEAGEQTIMLDAELVGGLAEMDTAEIIDAVRGLAQAGKDGNLLSPCMEMQ